MADANPSRTGTGGNPAPSSMQAYTRQYSYDKMGNILQLKQTAGNTFTRNFHYDGISTNNLLHSIKKADNTTDYATFTYDANGNKLTAGTERKYLWGHADQLKAYVNQAGTGEPSVYALYLYSAGQRVKKLVRNSGGNTETTVYIDGVFEHKYDGINAQSIVRVGGVATVRTGYAFDGLSGTSYELSNHLGSVSIRLDGSGGIIDKEEYYPFGDSSVRTWSGKRYRYVGKEKDNESGLYYYGARYYSAWTCRFVSVDPLAWEYSQLTPYNYAGNKPINHLDIDGMQSSGGDEKSENNNDNDNSSSEENNTGEHPDNIVFSPDGKRIYNKASGEKNWDYGIFNEETGSFDLHKINSEDGLTRDEMDAQTTISAVQNEAGFVEKRSAEIYDSMWRSENSGSLGLGTLHWDSAARTKQAKEQATEEYWIKQFSPSRNTYDRYLFGIDRGVNQSIEPVYIEADIILLFTTAGGGNLLKAGFRGLSSVGMRALATASGVVSGRIGVRAIPVLAMNSGMEIKITGWIEQKIWKGLSKQIQKKFAATLKKGIVPPKGHSGIVKLTESEIIELAKKGMSGYTHKVKILGEGVSHYRVYGTIMKNGQFVGTKLLNT